MKDSLCLIDPIHVINDKSYSNLGELCLRRPSVYEYLAFMGSDERIVSGDCSDFDLLREFVKCLAENKDTESRAARSFFRVTDRFLGVSRNAIINGEISADKIWEMGYQALSLKENSLHGIIAKSGLTEIGVAVNDSGICLPQQIGDVMIEPVICPVPTLSELSNTQNSLEEIEDGIAKLSGKRATGAIFLSDFEFEEPNPYVASKALERLTAGATLKDKERCILKSQLLRRAVLSFANGGGKLMMFLPTSPNLDALYHLKRFLDYADGMDLPSVKLILFASDLVGYSFVLSEMAARHKKITVEAAISGNDCCMISDDEIKYWGGVMPRYQASLTRTGVGLI